VSFNQKAAIYGQGSAHLSIFLRRLILRPKRHDNVIPTRSSPAARPPQHPFQRRRRLLFDCCMKLIKRPLKAKVPPSLYFSIEVTNPPKTSKLTTASATPIARRLRMVLGSSCAMIWWRHCSTHGEREGKAAFVGLGAAHLVSCRVMCVCVCVFFFFFFFWPLSYLSGKAEMANFWASFHKICAQRQPISRRVTNPHYLVMCNPCLLVDEMQVLIDLSGRKKCTKILLGRVPSYFFSILPGFLLGR
jgi:hypothetical protein